MTWKTSASSARGTQQQFHGSQRTACNKADTDTLYLCRKPYLMSPTTDLVLLKIWNPPCRGCKSTGRSRV